MNRRLNPTKQAQRAPSASMFSPSSTSAERFGGRTSTSQIPIAKRPVSVRSDCDLTTHILANLEQEFQRHEAIGKERLEEIKKSIETLESYKYRATLAEKKLDEQKAKFEGEVTSLQGQLELAKQQQIKDQEQQAKSEASINNLRCQLKNKETENLQLQQELKSKNEQLIADETLHRKVLDEKEAERLKEREDRLDAECRCIELSDKSRILGEKNAELQSLSKELEVIKEQQDTTDLRIQSLKTDKREERETAEQEDLDLINQHTLFSTDLKKRYNKTEGQLSRLQEGHEELEKRTSDLQRSITMLKIENSELRQSQNTSKGRDRILIARMDENAGNLTTRFDQLGALLVIATCSIHDTQDQELLRLVQTERQHANTPSTASPSAEYTTAEPRTLGGTRAELAWVRPKGSPGEGQIALVEKSSASISRVQVQRI